MGRPRSLAGFSLLAAGWTSLLLGSARFHSSSAKSCPIVIADPACAWAQDFTFSFWGCSGGRATNKQSNCNKLTVWRYLASPPRQCDEFSRSRGAQASEVLCFQSETSYSSQKNNFDFLAWWLGRHSSSNLRLEEASHFPHYNYCLLSSLQRGSSCVQFCSGAFKTPKSKDCCHGACSLISDTSRCSRPFSFYWIPDLSAY